MTKDDEAIITFRERDITEPQMLICIGMFVAVLLWGVMLAWKARK